MSEKMPQTVTPYGKESKKVEVAEMFDTIAYRYDFLNRLLSMGIDTIWRKKAINYLKPHKPSHILDIATGTGDLAIEALRLKPQKVTGVDISEEMLSNGREKLRRKKLDDRIELRYGDSENLDFETDTFDGLTVAYGVRNFENLDAGLSEMNRVLKPGARAVVLEFSRPNSFPVKQLFNFYFSKICPLIGRLVSKDDRAYTYLYESVSVFPEGEDFLDRMRKAGFKSVSCERLTFGISSIYSGVK